MKHKYRTRVQGESLQVKISEIEWNIMETILFPGVFLILTIWVWMAAAGFMTFNWLTAVFMSIVTAFLTIRAYRKVKEDRTKLRAYRKGLEGERLVGEFLNSLSDCGFLYRRSREFQGILVAERKVVHHSIQEIPRGL